MSFQGPGGGISGTSNQFQTGYSQTAGYAPQAGYANQASATSQTLQIQGTGSSNWAWAGQPGNPNHYWGSNDGYYMYVWQMNQGYVGYAGSAGNINGYAPQAGYANQAAATAQTLQLTSAGSSQWGWQGQSSNPAWLWGSNQGNVDTVFAPGALQVGYAGYAGSAGNINGYAPYAGSAGNINGYAPLAGASNGVNSNVGYGAQLNGSVAFIRSWRSGINGNTGGWISSYSYYQQGPYSAGQIIFNASWNYATIVQFTGGSTQGFSFASGQACQLNGNNGQGNLSSASYTLIG